MRRLMNTFAGIVSIEWPIKLAFCVSLCLILLLSACATSFQETTVTNIPVAVSKQGTQGVNLDVIRDVAEQRVRSTLSGAYFQGMVFSGKCQDLPQLQGKVVLIFAQVRPAIPGQQVVRAFASINTDQKTMDIHYVDESEAYPLTERREFSGDRTFKEIADAVYQQITELGLSDCDVTLTQVEDDAWDVRCGPLDNFVQECRFGVVNGKIQDHVDVK